MEYTAALSTMSQPHSVCVVAKICVILFACVCSAMADVGKTRTGSSSSTPSRHQQQLPQQQQQADSEGESPSRQVDPFRTYLTTHWQLQPQLRLISWAPGSLHFQNPAVEWLLQTLGFQHPRDTIPKWTQRTLMDPLDLLMSTMAKSVNEMRKIQN